MLSVIFVLKFDVKGQVKAYLHIYSTQKLIMNSYYKCTYMSLCEVKNSQFLVLQHALTILFSISLFNINEPRHMISNNGTF